MAIQIAKKKNEKPDYLYLTGFMLLQFCMGKNPKNWDFFGIFKHCQIGVYSENRINLTVAKNLAMRSICWRKNNLMFCSANYPNRVYVEQLEVPLLYPRISDNANGLPNVGRVVQLIKNVLKLLTTSPLSCFAIIFQQNFYRNALINMMIFAFFKLDVACVFELISRWTIFPIE